MNDFKKVTEADPIIKDTLQKMYQLNKTLCIQDVEEIAFLNDFSSMESKSIRVHISKCLNSTFNGYSCAPPDEINTFIKGVAIN